MTIREKNRHSIETFNCFHLPSLTNVEFIRKSIWVISLWRNLYRLICQCFNYIILKRFKQTFPNRWIRLEASFYDKTTYTVNVELQSKIANGLFISIKPQTYLHKCKSNFYLHLNLNCNFPCMFEQTSKTISAQSISIYVRLVKLLKCIPVTRNTT